MTIGVQIVRNGLMENVQRLENSDVAYEGYRFRRNKELKKGITFLIVGFAYLIWCRFTGIGIPCVFHLVTGLDCPGCGITRAVIAVSKLDFKRAFELNRLSFTVIPVLAVLLSVREYRYIKTGTYLSASKKVQLIENIILTVLIICTLGYFVERNLPEFREMLRK